MDIMLERILLSIPKLHGAKSVKMDTNLDIKNSPTGFSVDGGLLYLSLFCAMSKSINLLIYSLTLRRGAKPRRYS